MTTLENPTMKYSVTIFVLITDLAALQEEARKHAAIFGFETSAIGEVEDALCWSLGLHQDSLPGCLILNVDAEATVESPP